ELEASFVLSPGFAIDAADADLPAPYRIGDPDHGGLNLEKYRRFVVDELGEGHWAWGDSPGWVTGKTPDLEPVLGARVVDRGVDQPYVRRRRPGGRVLFSRDEFGEPLRAQVWISTDYVGPAPGVWDRTGTWQQCHGGWELLTQALGIRLEID